MAMINRRHLILSIGGAATGALAGCTDDSQDQEGEDEKTQSSDSEQDSPSTENTDNEESDEPDPEQSETDSDEPDNSTDESEEIASPIDPKEFSGSGTKVIQDAELGEGLVVADVTHESESEISNIVVTAINADGGEERQIFQDRDGKSGEGANVIEGGKYHIEVDGDGEWLITLKQPRVSKAEAETLPIEISGERSSVVGPYLFDGVHVATITHSGDLDVIVTVWPMKGPWSDYQIPILEGGKGTYEGTLSFDGIGWVHVEATGEWTLEIS